MEATPEEFTAKQTGRVNHLCPSCKTQNTSDREDTGWFFCPMMDKKLICVGCCIDFQSTARHKDFQNHPYRDLFDELSQATGKYVTTLRRTCLEHQEVVVLENVKSPINQLYTISS